MSKLILFFFLVLSFSISAQPDFLGTQLPDGLYNTYNLEDLGAFRRVKLQAVSSAASDTRIWEFATGDYFENWRPYSFPLTIVKNQVIDPSTMAASARYNNNYGGSSSYLPALIASNYYTFNVTEYAPPSNQFMSVLETTYDPVTIDMLSSNPSGDPAEDVPVTITVTTSSAPAVGEYVYLRYSTDNFATSNIVEFSFSSNTGTAQIPGLPETTVVQYYAYSSNETEANIATSVVNNGEVAHDMLSLNIINNSGLPYIYTVQAPLPVELLNFVGFFRNGSVELHWETASEYNNSHFSIQRSSDSKSWHELGKRLGHGTSIDLIKYTYIDTAPKAGGNYYRLKQVDFDGSIDYSEIVFVHIGFDDNFTVYPNPAREVLYFNNPNLGEENYEIYIYNSVGQKVLEKNQESKIIDISQLSNGLYFLQIEIRGQIIQRRITIEK